MATIFLNIGRTPSKQLIDGFDQHGQQYEVARFPDRKPTGTRWLLIGATLLVVGIAAVAGFALSQGRLPFGAPSFNGVLMQSPEPVPDFEMMSSTGERVRLSDFHGKPVLLYGDSIDQAFCTRVGLPWLSPARSGADELLAAVRQALASPFREGTTP